MTTVVSSDYYALLGVGEEAGAAELRNAWRRLALPLPADSAEPGAHLLFQAISTAYAVLSDPAARAEYDRRRAEAARGAGEEKPAPGEGRRAPGVMLSRLSGSLQALLAGGVVRRAEGGAIELLLNADEAAQGGMVSISMRVPIRCPECGGGDAASCHRCEGRGTEEEVFSAWLAVRPGVSDGTLLPPSALLPGMVRPVAFRARLGAGA